MSVLNLSDLKTFLNITTTKDDGELQDTLDAAEATVARQLGLTSGGASLEPTVVTRRLYSFQGMLRLPSAAVSLQTVTGPSWSPSVPGATLAGLTLVDGTITLPSYSRVGWYTVTYTAGFYVLPPDLAIAVKELARHLWQSQRGPTARPGSTPDVPAPGYLLPNRVREILAAYELPGIA